MRLAALLVLPALLAGCQGPSCQAACDKIFGDGDGECNIIPAGVTTEVEIQRLERDCVAQCQAALANPGEITDGYDPNERNSSADVSLHTDKDAAIWMECVEQTACEDLDGGYCAPTKSF